MDISDDMEVSNLSASFFLFVFCFFKVNYSFNPYPVNYEQHAQKGLRTMWNKTYIKFMVM